MTEKPKIEEIDERARDLIATLRQVDAKSAAAAVEKIIRGFKFPTEVRRAVSDLQRQLEQWREDPGDFPDTVRAKFEAQQLEDACRLILGIGTGRRLSESLRPLPLTIWDRLRRYLRVAVVTAIAGAAVLAAPIAVVELGFDWINYKFRYETETIEVPKGSEVRVDISVLGVSELPRQTRLIKIFPRNWCRGTVFRDILAFQQWTCENSERILAADGSPTYEMKQTGQYHGVLFSVINTRLVGSVGHGTVQLFAVETTAPGLYKMPLEAAYRGYRPAECSGFGILRKCDQPVASEESEHTGLRVPTLVVRVVEARSIATQEVKTQVEVEEDEEARLEAEQKEKEKQQLLEQLGRDVETALQDAVTLRKHLQSKAWIKGRDALRELATRHDELNERVRNCPNPSAFRENMVELRRRIEQERTVLEKFENRVFDAIFEALHESSVPERDVVAARIGVARHHDIPSDYVEEIYNGRLGEARIRLKKQAQQKLARDHAEWVAAQKKCGESPKAASDAVERYLRNLLRDPNLAVDECSSPRFAEKQCWVVTCSFFAEGATGMQKKYRWRFFMERNRVTRHGL